MTVEQTLLDTLKTLDMSARQFARLADMKHWNVERLMRNEMTLDSYDSQRITTLCAELVDLQQSFPIDLDWDDSARILAALATRREQADRDTFLQKQAERRQRIQQLQQ